MQPEKIRRANPSAASQASQHFPNPKFQERRQLLCVFRIVRGDAAEHHPWTHYKESCKSGNRTACTALSSVSWSSWIFGARPLTTRLCGDLRECGQQARCLGSVLSVPSCFLPRGSLSCKFHKCSGLHRQHRRPAELLASRIRLVSRYCCIIPNAHKDPGKWVPVSYPPEA